jgi:Icc-related predicted phosphoesterase
LLDSGEEIEGVKFWGSPPPPPPPGNHWSFNLTYAYTKEDADEVWDQIPDDTDILVTHGPPKGILDLVPGSYEKFNPENVGCPYLLEHVMERVKPKLHVFGHIHEGYGITTRKVDDKHIMFVNASVHNGKFKPKNAIRVVNVSF